jgi:hypothetical protein
MSLAMWLALGGDASLVVGVVTVRVVTVFTGRSGVRVVFTCLHIVYTILIAIINYCVHNYCATKSSYETKVLQAKGGPSVRNCSADYCWPGGA